MELANEFGGRKDREDRGRHFRSGGRLSPYIVNSPPIKRIIRPDNPGRSVRFYVMTQYKSMVDNV